MRNKIIHGLAPQKFVDWLDTRRFVDNEFGFVYRYHPRSDEHSKALCRFILEDLQQNSALIAQHLDSGKIVAGINYPHIWPTSGKPKTIDLALGIPSSSYDATKSVLAKKKDIARVLISCEAKATMTEHGKSEPRLFDELESSYIIVNDGDPSAVAAGVEVLNIADRFVSPLRQRTTELKWTKHNQPDVTIKMLAHLRRLHIRDGTTDKGFDAFGCIVIDCDNINYARLVVDLPAPQPGDRDYYDAFLNKIIETYESRYSAL